MRITTFSCKIVKNKNHRQESGNLPSLLLVLGPPPRVGGTLKGVDGYTKRPPQANTPNRFAYLLRPSSWSSGLTNLPEWSDQCCSAAYS